ncbi:hypothetical protein JCM9279_006458 [Rhodotorula babjevae]
MDASSQLAPYSYETATNAIDAAARAWVSWREKTKIGTMAVTYADANAWTERMKTHTLPGDWWSTWPRRDQEAFLRDMLAIEESFKGVVAPRTKLSYNRVVYLAMQISRFVHDFSSSLVGVDEHGHPVRGELLLGEASFDAEHDKTRKVVIGQLQRVLDGLRAGELSDAQAALLPQLHDRRNVQLLALVRMIARIHGPQADAAAVLLDMHGAHSLAHAPADRVKLSPRQQVRYGRQYAGL